MSDFNAAAVSIFDVPATSAARDLTIWHQATGRAPDASCPAGYGPSWAEWPNSRTGGFVCTRDVYAYYPTEPVVG